MIEFEEPEKDYVFEGSNIIKNKPKLRLLVLLVTFFIVIGFFVRNDYNFNFFNDNRQELKFNCSEEALFNHHDTKEVNYQRAKKALAENIVLLNMQKEFQKNGITFEEGKSVKTMRPVINLTFTEEPTFKLPTRMCNFELRIFYK